MNGDRPTITYVSELAAYSQLMAMLASIDSGMSLEDIRRDVAELVDEIEPNILPEDVFGIKVTLDNFDRKKRTPLG